ncbi:hypothetical protein ABZS39_26960, partial [Micromonospora luteifusca]
HAVRPGPTGQSGRPRVAPRGVPRVLRSAYDLAGEVAHGRASAPLPVPTGCAGELDRIRPLLSEGDPRSVRHLVEVDRWLASLADSLARIHPR